MSATEPSATNPAAISDNLVAEINGQPVDLEPGVAVDVSTVDNPDQPRTVHLSEPRDPVPLVDPSEVVPAAEFPAGTVKGPDPAEWPGASTPPEG